MALNPRQTLANWTMLLALTVLWGSAFAFTKVAVGGLPPELVVGGRLALASALLFTVVLATARRLPRGRRLWLSFGLIALFGNVLPFSLITWGQGFIDSGVAGILMAVMPLMTLGLSHYFVAGERLTPLRVLGFLAGLAGVVVLMGPEALGQLVRGGGDLIPMLAVLAGAGCYSVAAVLARLRPDSDALGSAAATTLFGTAMMLPFALDAGADLALAATAGAQWAAVAVLGVFSTATATVIYFRLIRTAGPTFTSQMNYLIPLWAVLIGVVFLGESPEPRHLYALGLILSGLLATHAASRHGRSWAGPACRAPA